MAILVRATAQGYYGQFREVDTEFEIDDEAAFHKSWMERVDGPRSANKRAKPVAQTTGNNPGPKQQAADPDFDTLA